MVRVSLITKKYSNSLNSLRIFIVLLILRLLGGRLGVLCLLLPDYEYLLWRGVGPGEDALLVGAAQRRDGAQRVDNVLGAREEIPAALERAHEVALHAPEGDLGDGGGGVKVVGVANVVVERVLRHLDVPVE